MRTLRRNCVDCKKPHHDDFFYLRWLLARDFDVEAAEKMLRDNVYETALKIVVEFQSLKWREEWQVDSLLSWKAPESVVNYYPSGLTGYDKEGAPVVVIPFAGLDMWGMLHTVRRSDFIRMTLQKIEYFMMLCEEQTKKHGQQASKVNLIIDMENFNIRQYTWRPAPKIFAFAFSIIKKFMKEYTLRKIQIYKNDPEKWQPLLLKVIDADQLPKHYGGTMVDPDGNPKCPSKVNPGGTIPKSLYYKKPDKSATQEKFTKVVVKKGDKIQIPFIATDEGSFLKWEFRTEGHDIRFGITYADVDGNESVAVPLQRITCFPASETGEIACQSPATYTVTFDNSYSFLRNKTLHYSVFMKSPENNVEVNGPQDISGNIKSISLSET
ncbi:SEC14-like protein 2 [Gryllus bimaculatus]|nr:SEC14-like protein 2 [Gryllus bimaculatus]